MVARFVTLAALTMALAPLQASQAPARTVTDLGWIAGCWTRTLPDGVNEEHWMKPAGGSMLGMSRTVRGGRTTEFEFLRITEVDGSLAYVAKPSGQGEATFLVKTLTDREVVFENPKHDFPQRVIYRQASDGTVSARIEGAMNGQLRVMDFPYARCK